MEVTKLLPRLLGAASKRCMSSTSEMTVWENLNSALDEEMSADSKVFVLGEEVGEHQGAYKITVPEALRSNCLDDLNNRLNALEGQLKAKLEQVHALDNALKMSFDGLEALGKTLNDQWTQLLKLRWMNTALYHPFSRN